MEQRLPVVGYEGLYDVSNLGRIRSYDKFVDAKLGSKKFQRGCIMKGTIIQGYISVNLTKNLIRKPKRIHRLVAEVFISNPENKPRINHKNGIRNDNRVENLERSTPSENEYHSYRELGRKSAILGMKGKDSPNKLKIGKYSLKGELIKVYYGLYGLAEELGVKYITLYRRYKNNKIINNEFILKNI